ncbi:MAG TPA: MXAN_5808 family serine peptidase [Anaeromyxobacteraceae bacterium]|nr:MXAN_5808 family serine peptidase [Anaeromyxobacteraceae bacterium]
MNRIFRLLAAAAVALAVAAGVSLAVTRSPEPPRPGPTAATAVASNGAHGVAESSDDTSDDSDPSYRLDKLPVLSRVVIYVKENYVDPHRIDPKAMLASSLDQVVKTVAEVMVEGDVNSGRIKVTVGSATREFDVSHVDSIWQFRASLGEIMGFVQDNLVAHKNLRDIEYAAVNGMLQTLDPHSVLLEPKFFKEMKLQTRGEFGGLGFVIGMRDGNLTVMKVLKGTPAQKAGVKPKDVIAKIEEQSTINMDLQEAVDQLRGKPGTRVNITVVRAGAEPKRLALVREIINVETVPFARLLEQNVGYVKVQQFSANTTRDLSAAIAQQKAQAGGRLQGLILDLRGNPGGLLEQAIQVSDLFLSQGVIVKTVGEGDRHQIHEVKEAHADRSDMVDLPIVVLVNNASASASEIVAGALKNNNRALVIGRQTFGKGSVQVLYDFADPSHPGEDSALKLTIAQYLTPGDISIQEVGIVPDVTLQPGRALKDAVNYFAPPRSMGEVDLDKHFQNPLLGSGTDAAKRAEERKKRAEKSPLELRYLLDEKEDVVAKAMKKEAREEARLAHDEADLTPEQLEDDEADANPDELVEDYQIRFAKDLLARAPYPDRARQLEAAKTLVAERRVEEQARLQQRLQQLGVDWSTGPATGTPRAVVTLSPPEGKPIRAGETAQWTMTVENRGDGPIFRLRAWSSDEKNPFLDRREFVFGAVRPGQKRTWTVPLKVPRGMDSRVDLVTFRLEDEDGHALPDASARIEVLERPKPRFAFNVQVDDEASGNGDGLIERGEEFLLRVDVKNTGDGASSDKTFVSLKNLGDDKVFIKKGRAVIGALAPGESHPAAMQLEVKKGIKADKVPLRVMVVDEKGDEFVTEKIEIAVLSDPPTRSAMDGSVRVTAPSAVVRSGASAEAAPLALAPKGTVLPASARVGGFYKVEWEKGRFGFVAAAEAQPSRAKREGTVTAVWQRDPPRIALVPDPARGAPVVDDDHMHLEGKASVLPGVGPGAGRLRDVFVFVNDQKVFFRVVPDGKSTDIDFATDVPLKPGNNVVTVVAREDEEFQSRRSVVVHRREPAEVAQKK